MRRRRRTRTLQARRAVAFATMLGLSLLTATASFVVITQLADTFDMAMDAAKELGKNRCVVLDPDVHATSASAGALRAAGLPRR